MGENRLEHAVEVAAVNGAGQELSGLNPATDFCPKDVYGEKGGGVSPPQRTEAWSAENASAYHVLPPGELGHEEGFPAYRRCANRSFLGLWREG